MNLTVNELCDAIVAMKNADDLDRLARAVRAQQKFVRSQHAEAVRASLSDGDVVMFRSTRPQYLIGAVAEVVDVTASKVRVRMLESRRRYTRGMIVTVPANCLMPAVSVLDMRGLAFDE